MFKSVLHKVFGSKQPAQDTPVLSPQTEVMIQSVRARSAEDPLIGAKIGAKEIFQRMVDGMRNEKGVHIESLFCALGALAGYSCQASLRAQAIAKGMSETAPFHTVETKSGEQYFFGDPLNHALVNAKYSVWGLAGGAAQQAGCQDLLDLDEIFTHTMSTLGGSEFGVPRVPERHKAGDMPVNYLKGIWPAMFPTVKLFCPNPVDWPILFGLATQQAIALGAEQNVIDPGMALKIVMESALPMSKVDFANI